MPFYTLWEKRLIYLVPAGAPGHPDQGLPGVPAYPDQGLPPGVPGYPDQGLPGGGGPPLYPSHPWVPGGGGSPSHPIYNPPGIWPKPPVYPSHPWVPGGGGYPDQGLPPGSPGYPDQGLPGGGRLPVYAELPDDVAPPSSPPAGPPDLASPGYWVTVVIDGANKSGFVQTAIIADPEHVAKPPTKGLPGEWLAVYNTETSVAAYAWLPTKALKPEPKAEPQAKATRA